MKEKQGFYIHDHSRRVAMVWNDMQWYSYSLPFLLMQTFWMDTHWMDPYWWDTCWRYVLVGYVLVGYVLRFLLMHTFWMDTHWMDTPGIPTTPVFGVVRWATPDFGVVREPPQKCNLMFFKKNMVNQLCQENLAIYDRRTFIFKSWFMILSSIFLKK